jgi:hypothetical protein
MNVSSSSGHHVSFADSVGGLLATNLAQDGRRGVKRKRLHDESLTYGNQQARSFKVLFL